jgi:hypothetical protein
LTRKLKENNDKEAEEKMKEIQEWFRIELI